MNLLNLGGDGEIWSYIKPLHGADIEAALADMQTAKVNRNLREPSRLGRRKKGKKSRSKLSPQKQYANTIRKLAARRKVSYRRAQEIYRSREITLSIGLSVFVNVRRNRLYPSVSVDTTTATFWTDFHNSLRDYFQDGYEKTGGESFSVNVVSIDATAL